MKKQYLAVAFLAVALGITACSSKKADTESTTAQEVESTEATSDEEVEEDYYYGFVSLVEDNVITVSEDGGNTAKFDISDAEITGADEIGEGDEVNVGFAGELSSDVTKATSVEIMTSAAEVAREEEADQEDLVVEGTIESADDSTITLKTEEGTYTVEAYSPGTPIIDGLKMGFVGGWFDGAKGWDGPKNVYELTQDPDNPHCLTAELTWSKQDSFDVTITPYDANGAWLEPGWRFDGKNESFATNTNDSSKKVPAGKYTFIFDTHLVQSKLLKK